MDHSIENAALDLAVVLHSHSAQLSNVLEWLEPIARYVGTNPFRGSREPTPADLEHALQEPVAQLCDTIQRYVNSPVFDAVVEDYEQQIKTLREISAVLEHYVTAAVGKRVRAPFLYEQVQCAVEASHTLEQGRKRSRLPREICARARAVQRLICIYDLMVASFTLKEMQQQANALHGFYSYNVRTDEPVVQVTVYELLQAVIQENAAFAASRDIELRPSGYQTLNIAIRKRDMIRALGQLVRNAIKYNYTMEDYPVWVDIRSSRTRQRVQIEVENWGYPITSDELARGTIFHVGRRGTFAARSGMPGNGIGLADAKRVIEDHDGTIAIRSIPARKNARPDQYSSPFITTVVVELPEAI
jgi:hypothetical protein